MIPKLVIDQNKIMILFISEILKEECDKILNDVWRLGSSEIEIIKFKQFKNNEVFIPNKLLNLYLAIGAPDYWSSVPFLETTLFYSFTNRPISSYFNNSEYNIIDFNGITLKDIILNYINSWKLMNLK